MTTLKIGTIIMPTFETKKLRHRKVKSFAQALLTNCELHFLMKYKFKVTLPLTYQSGKNVFK